MAKAVHLFKPSFPLAVFGATALGLYASSLYSYLLFHTLVELFSVLTGFMVFTLAWNTRRINDNTYLLFIGIASLFTSALELVHVLAYKGMGVFPSDGANLATQFWIAFRLMVSLSFLIASFFIGKQVHAGKTVAVFTAAVAGIIASVFLEWFPDCYDEARGLTQFKIVTEYVICFILLAALVLLILKRRYFDPWVLGLMVLSLVFSIGAELSFTQYVSVYGFANMLGHLFLLASVVLIYRAVVVTGVVEPSRLLFRELKQREEAVRASETKYRRLFENMSNGFAYHRIVTDEKGAPVDYVFLEANRAFEAITGLKRTDIIGKRVREALPGIENDPANWIGVYGDVAITGKDVRFEQHAVVLEKWYSVTAYSPMKEHFVTIVEDITERKRIEEELHRAQEKLELRVRERTAELARTNEELEQEIGVRSLAERDLRSSEERFRTSVENLLDGFALFSAVRNEAGRIVDFRYEYINRAGCQLNRRTCEEHVGRTLLEVLPLLRESELFDEYVRVVETGEPLTKSGFLQDETYGGGRRLSRAWDLQAVKLGNGLAVIWRDVSDRRESERCMRLTNELLKLYTRKISRKEYLDVVVDLIREGSGCRHAGVRVADGNGNIPFESCKGYSAEFLSTETMLSTKDDQCICIRVTSGEAEPSTLIVNTPTGSAYTNETLRFVDTLTDDQQVRYRSACMRHGYRSLAVVPIRYRDTILGALHVADERAGMLPRRNVEFLEQLAFIIGEALFRFGVEEDVSRQQEDLIRINEQLRNLSAHVDAVREGERTNIAREIHDELGQTLTAIKIDVTWIRNRLPAGERSFLERTSETLRIIDHAIQSVKRISAELRPGVLDDIGLAAAIEWAAKDFQKRTGIECAISIRPDLAIDRMHSTALFRILQEALTNIIRHARATKVSVYLEEKNGGVLLTIADNGKGIKKDEISSSHSFGLIGMRERVQFLGGRVKITGRPNRGTTVSVELPVRAGKEQPASPTRNNIGREGVRER